jgi:hypothetical protein
MVHRLPPLAFSISTLPEGPCPRLALSPLRRSASRVLSKSFGPVDRPDHPHEDLFQTTLWLPASPSSVPISLRNVVVMLSMPSPG